MKNILYIICMIPVILAVFPIPLALPIGLIFICIDHPEEWPLAIIYFSYLFISLFIIYRLEHSK